MSKNETPHTIDLSIVEEYTILRRFEPVRLFFHADGGSPPCLIHAWQRTDGLITAP